MGIRMHGVSVFFFFLTFLSILLSVSVAKSYLDLDSLAVDPAQQRRGIGKMLVQWGQDRADEEHKNVRFTSSEKGAKLYRSLGYEEIGSLEICKGTEYAFIKKAA